MSHHKNFCHILYIDDDHSMHSFFKEVLLPCCEYHFEYHFLSSIHEGKILLSIENKFDLIICDYNTGETENGLDFFKYVTAKFPNQKFILFTGHPLDQQALAKKTGNNPNLQFNLEKDWIQLKEQMNVVLGNTKDQTK